MAKVGWSRLTRSMLYGKTLGSASYWVKKLVENISIGR